MCEETLRKYWNEWEALKGRCLSLSYLEQPRIHKLKKVGKEWIGSMREELSRAGLDDICSNTLSNKLVL